MIGICLPKPWYNIWCRLSFSIWWCSAHKDYWINISSTSIYHDYFFYYTVSDFCTGECSVAIPIDLCFCTTPVPYFNPWINVCMPSCSIISLTPTRKTLIPIKFTLTNKRSIKIATQNRRDICIIIRCGERGCVTKRHIQFTV